MLFCSLQLDKAHSLLKKTKKPEKLAIVMDKRGDHDGVIRLLAKCNKIVDALKYAKKYESQKHHISRVHSVKFLANRRAGELANLDYADEASSAEFAAILEYLPLRDKVDYFKIAGMHDKACEILMKEGKYDEELRKIYQGQGWYEEGMQFAKNQRDRLTFALYKATSEFQDGKLMNASAVDYLKNMGGSTEARTSLILGMLTKDPTMTKSALQDYKRNHQSIGHVEAFRIAIEQAVYDEETREWKNIFPPKNENVLDLALSACKEVRSTIDSLTARTPSNLFLAQVINFYGLEERLAGKVYLVPPSSYPWTNELLKESNIETRAKDVNGMLQLDVELVHKCICNRLESFLRSWIVDDKFKLVETFYKVLRQHPFHEKMISGGHLTEMVPASDYFQMLTSEAFDIAHYRNTNVSETDEMKALLSSMSPQATCYLPFSSLKINSDILVQTLHKEACYVLESSDKNFIFDKWLEAWRMNCVTKKGLHEMKDVLIDKTAVYNKTKQQSQDQDSPPVYVLDSTKEYRHLMLLWIYTCEHIGRRKILCSCTIAVHNIIGHIASHRTIWTTTSMSNFLHIVTIHTTAILTMHASLSAFMQRECSIYVPFSYKRVLETFQTMNFMPGLGPPRKDFFKSCIEDAKRRNVSGFFTQLRKLLTIIIEVMIGMYNKSFNPLKYALSNESCLENHEAQHCLIFVLILFGNIGITQLFSDSELQVFREKIYDSANHCKNTALKEACHQFATTVTVVGIFGAVKKLLEVSKDSLTCVHFSRVGNEVKLSFKQTSPNEDISA